MSSYAVTVYGDYVVFYIYRLEQGFILNYGDKTYVLRDLDDLHKTMAALLVAKKLDES